MDPDAPTSRPAPAPAPRARRSHRAAGMLAALALLTLAAPKPASAQPATPASSPSCHEAVQGEVAWNYDGTTRWAEGNVDRLCEGAEDSAEPARCFQEAMHGGLRRGDEGTRWRWQDALALCRGTRDADATIACFRDRTRGGMAWREAVDACGPDAPSAEVVHTEVEDGDGDGGDGGDDGEIIVAPHVIEENGAEVVAAAGRGERAIAAKYRELGGRSGRLGPPEAGARKLVSRGRRVQMRRYERGHIYWTPGAGAHVLYFGPIGDKWFEMDASELGFPIQDPRTNPDETGRRQRFEGGHIYWHPRTGAHVIYEGLIWEKWADQSWEEGPLGYPTSDRVDRGEVIVQRFEHGRLMEREIGGRYLTAASGLCLTLNVFDQPDSRRDRVKRALKKAFDPREHAKAIAAGAGAALVFGPGGGELASTIQHLRTAKKVGEAWQGDLVHGTGVTLLECGSVAPRFQRFERDDRFVRVVAKPGECVKAKQGQTERNGGRVQMGACKQHQRAAWYVDDGQLRNGKGKCLDVHAPQLDQEGAKVQLWSCNGSRQQRWSFRRP